MSSPGLIVIAKAPVPGRVKTRLTPPCSPAQAAALAEAALADTLAAAAGTGFPVTLALEGSPGPWLPAGRRVEIVVQGGAGLDERLARAFADAGGPALLIGMDTPQVTPALLVGCLEALMAPGTRAVLGLAADGGWWAIGLRRPDPAVFLGVPMSTGVTGQAQRARLASLGLHPRALPVLTDIDTWADAVSVPVAPTSRFASAVAAVRRTLQDAPARRREREVAAR